MPIISHMGVDYDSPNIQIQDNASATDLDNTKVPTGQTIESYLNSKLSWTLIKNLAMTSSDQDMALTNALSSYKELLFVGIASGFAPMESFVYPADAISDGAIIYVNVFQDTSYRAQIRLEYAISGNKFKARRSSLVGWTAINLAIYGR